MWVGRNSSNVVHASDSAEPKFKSQFGEDRLLAEHFRNKPDGFCVEVGANDGIDCSNTYYFEQVGWRCLLVEADPDLAAACSRSRPKSLVANFAAVGPDSAGEISFEVVEGCRALSSISVKPETLDRAEFLGESPSRRRIVVPAKTMDSILEDAGFSSIDFVTIDVEGHEFEVLRGFNLERWKPHIVILERNTHFPDARIIQRLHDSGYAYVRTTGVNDWFVRWGRRPWDDPAYRGRLICRYYLPLWLTSYKMLQPAALKMKRAFRRLFVDPLRASAKRLLEKLGLMKFVKSLLGRS